MYVELSELRSWIGAGSTETGDDAILQECLDSAQREIENYCKRTFESSTGTRYYRNDDLVDLPGLGGSGNVLWLGKDLLSVDTLTNGDETAFTSTEYWLEPRNAADNGKPYQYVRLRTGQSWIFDTDGEVSVAGSWGYSTAPDATIIQYTKELAHFIYLMRKSPTYDVTATPELGIITIPKGTPAHVKQGLDNGGYKRTRIV